MQAYKALALQCTCFAINRMSHAEARQSMMKSLDRIKDQIRGSKNFIGDDLKLVVVPEYFLTSYPTKESIMEWKDKACIAPEGPEFEAMQKMAMGLGIYFSGNVYETDPNFPDLYFQSSFIINDQGEQILRYRRLNSMYAPTPHDIWDRYLEVYGLDKVFPVADTALGKLACIASEEIVYPEIARCLAMRGAEVFLHSSSEVASPRSTPKNIAKQARAIENLAYVVSANSAGIANSPIPLNSTDGSSKIVDYTGMELIVADTGESMVANAELDLTSLRRYRQRPGMFNILSRQRNELYAQSYADFSIYPPNSLDGKAATRAHFDQTQAESLEKMKALGIIP